MIITQRCYCFGRDNCTKCHGSGVVYWAVMDPNIHEMALAGTSEVVPVPKRYFNPLNDATGYTPEGNKLNQGSTVVLLDQFGRIGPQIAEQLGGKPAAIGAGVGSVFGALAGHFLGRQR